MTALDLAITTEDILLVASTVGILLALAIVAGLVMAVIVERSEK